MDWSITQLALNVTLFCGVVVLFRSAPDTLQRLILVILAGAALVFCAASLLEISGEYAYAMVRHIALEIEHIGILLYVFRQWYVKTICPTFSRHFHSLPR